MRRALLILLSLVLALVGWGTVCAEDGFYVIPVVKGQYAPVPKTGQTNSILPKDDGDLQRGVASPTPRFTDNNNGTVTDNLTRLIWMQNADAFGAPMQTWSQAVSYANNLHDGSGGLADGSKAGDWRLPNIRELQSLIDYGPHVPPVLPADHPFTNIRMGGYYWSSTTMGVSTNYAYYLNFLDGSTKTGDMINPFIAWCVRGGS